MRVWLSWSSGKDSAWALHTLRQDPDVSVVGLLTSVNAAAGRVAMHAVREQLLRDQADAAGLPVHVVSLPFPCSNEDYEAVMVAALDAARRAGVDAIAFGDLYLQDIRDYRERQMRGTGLGIRFPLWGLDTRRLAHKMVDSGLRAYVTCVDPAQLDPSFVGRVWDADFLADLPSTVDPCGENGEFHTFVWKGPMWDGELDVEVGEIVHRDGFVYADLRRKNKDRVAQASARDTSGPTTPA